MNANTWFGVGRLTKAAELGKTNKGTPKAKFRIAVNDRQHDDTLFINVLCFGKMAESLQPLLVKGRLVSCRGRLVVDEYEDNDGNKRCSPCIMADDISLGPDPATIRSKENSVNDEPLPV